MEKCLKKLRFNTRESIIEQKKEKLRKFQKKGSSEALENLTRWQRCKNAECDYSEGDPEQSF